MSLLKELGIIVKAKLTTKVDADKVNQIGGFVGIQSDRKIDGSLIPAVPITNTTVANTPAEVTAKIAAALPGDVIIDNVTGQSLIKLADGTVTELNTPTDTVTSINGRKGNISKITLNDTSGIVGSDNKLSDTLIPSFTGDISNIGKTTLLKNITTAGTFTSVTVNEKGLVTGGTSGVSYTKIETDAKLDLKLSSDNFDKANGYAKVQSNNKIDGKLVPFVPITDTTVANTPAELTAKIASALPGDVIIDNTTGKSLIKLEDGTTVPLTTPTDTVTSINGKKGIIDKIALADTTGIAVDGKLDPTLFPALTGDIENTGLAVNLKSITTPGNFAKVTVNNKGLVTGGVNLVAGDIPDLDAAKITTGKFDLARLPDFNGDIITENGAVVLSTTGVAAGDYFKVNVDAKGRVKTGSNPTTLAGFGITDALSVDQKGVINGICPLDGANKIPVTHLPSYVDDVIEAADLTAIQALTGEISKIYVALDTNKTYRWSGSAYIEVSPSIATTDAGLLTSGTLAKERLPALTGTDVSSVIGTGELTLSTTGVAAGTYTSVTVDTKGRVTSGTNFDTVQMNVFNRTSALKSVNIAVDTSGIQDVVSLRVRNTNGTIKLFNVVAIV